MSENGNVTIVLFTIYAATIFYFYNNIFNKNEIKL